MQYLYVYFKKSVRDDVYFKTLIIICCPDFIRVTIGDLSTVIILSKKRRFLPLNKYLFLLHSEKNGFRFCRNRKKGEVN